MPGEPWRRRQAAGKPAPWHPRTQPPAPANDNPRRRAPLAWRAILIVAALALGAAVLVHLMA